MSAPRASGFWRRGVANVLSTAIAAPDTLAAALIALMSANSRVGLVGDSIQTSAASLLVLITSSELAMSTSRSSIILRRDRSVSWVSVPLYAVLGATTMPPTGTSSRMAVVAPRTAYNGTLTQLTD